MSEFYPNVVVICCRYCAYAAADLAGSERRSYPDCTSIVLLPCTGRVEEIMILRAFENGADGVMVGGCLEGNCHFLVGNFRARRRVERVAAILESAGIGCERVRMYNLSAGEGAKFARFTEEMVAHIRTLGPSPINMRRGKAGAADGKPLAEPPAGGAR